MKILGVIPARFASTRFPGKPLVDILGKTMIMRVYEQAKKASCLADVVVATDDERIHQHVIEHGGKSILTSPDHQSGTDRCFEAWKKTDEKFDVIINIQGDEPFIEPAQIEELANCFSDEKAEIATLVKRIENSEILFNPNKVKMVKNNDQFALYFSRHPIPFQKNQPQDQWLTHQPYYLHIGLYGYRASILQEITALPISPLEKAESLEQLRWLENGYRIKVAETQHEAFGVDVPEDLKTLLRTFGK